MKKFLVLLLCSMLAINCAAFTAGEISYTYMVDDTECTVTFSSDSVLSAEKQQQIAYQLVYGDDGASTYSWCWLTGHDLVTEGVAQIMHKVYDTVPRCVRRTFSIETCTKCDHYEETLVSRALIACCPEE